jgi:hypothetical protein
MLRLVKNLSFNRTVLTIPVQVNFIFKDSKKIYGTISDETSKVIFGCSIQDVVDGFSQEEYKNHIIPFRKRRDSNDYFVVLKYESENQIAPFADPESPYGIRKDVDALVSIRVIYYKGYPTPEKSGICLKCVSDFTE